MSLEPPSQSRGMGEHIVALAVSPDWNKYLADHSVISLALLLKQTLDETVIIEHDSFG